MGMELKVDQLKDIMFDYFQANNIPGKDIKLSSGCGKSDGFVSYVYRAIIDNGLLDVIVKSAPRQYKFRKLVPVRELYCTEIYVYSEIFKSFIALAEEKGVRFVRVPKLITICYDECNETVVLENICQTGFAMWDKRLAMDREHLELVLKEYGRFHAMSFALKSQRAKSYAKRISGLGDIHGGKCATLNEHFYDWYKGSLQQTKDLFKNHKEIHDRIQNISENLQEIFQKVYQYSGKYGVICHLDCWANNMMFKYNNNKLEELCILDFQYTMESSPTSDISYLFYQVASSSEYGKLDHYLGVYYRSLWSICWQLGYDLSSEYSFEDFLQEWKQFAKFGFLRAILGIPLNHREQEQVIDIKDVADNNHFNTELVFKVDEWSLKCKNCIYDLTLHMYQSGFLENLN